jgi:hypothetical protein
MKLFKIAFIIVIITFATCPKPDTGFSTGVNTGFSSDGNPSQTSEVKIDNQHASKETKQMEGNIAKLFNTDEYNSGACQKVDLEDKDKDILRPGAEYGGNVPKPHQNKWAKIGKREAAYFLDHLEFLFKEKLVKKFQYLYDEARKMKANGVDDPYTEETLIIQLAQGRNHKKGLGDFIKNFNQQAYEKAITLPQISEVIMLWKYYKETNPDFVKKTFDFYDFNGDGRLDMYEFILFTILHNKPIFGKQECKKDFCYDDILRELIDPMFSFFDCSKSNSVTAEEIWNGLKKLKRDANLDYSLFNCKIKLDFEKDYRTVSVSDFILQNRKNKDGQLDLDEFRLGILLGFWNRQVSSTSISDKDEFNSKADRWANNGKTDKFCEQIKYFLHGQKKSAANFVATK